jgi:type IV pilus secretin PilQ/predicted competence protein
MRPEPHASQSATLSRRQSVMVRTSIKGMFAGLFLLGAAFGPVYSAVAEDSARATLQNVEVVPGEETTVRFQMSTSVEGAAITSYLLSDPERLIVEIPDGLSMNATPPAKGLGGLVQRVEAKQVASTGVLELTLFLDRPIDHMLSTADDEVSVTLFERQAAASAEFDRVLSGPELPLNAPPTIATLDFQSLDNTSRVVIGMNSELDYTISKPESRLIVVDIPGATLAPSLERPLDASKFISAVSMVRAYRTRTGTRVAINLRRSVDYETRRGAGNLLYVDVEVPADMAQDRELAQQGFTASAPSTPASSGGEGLKSAYKEEILITDGGRTHNPQSAFGSGGGSYDPSSMTGLAQGFMFDSSSATNVPFSGQRINLDLVNADIHSVFRLISHVSKLNIVSGDDVGGQITVRLENVPWDQAFAAILQAKGLGSERFGNIVRIAPIETIKAEQQTKLETERHIRELEPLQTYVVPLNYAVANELVEQIEAVLSERGSVQVDPRTNQIIVQDREKYIAAVRELVRQLDTQNPQVMIEARIVEASSTFVRGLGVQWGSSLDASANTGYSTGTFFPNSIGVSGALVPLGLGSEAVFYGESSDLPLLVDLASPNGELGAIAMSLGSIPGLIDLDARLGAMESEGWGKVVSSPRIITMDNQSATIKQGSQIPYLATSAGGVNVKFVQAALELTVMPHITSDGRVFLDIQLKNDRPDFAQAVMGQPAIQIKEASTGALVEDGDTTVIGGVYAFETSNNSARIPLFSKIPLLGYMFKNSGENISRNEMLVFVTPHVLSQSSQK